MSRQRYDLDRRRFLQQVSGGAATLGVIPWFGFPTEKGREGRRTGFERPALPLRLARNESPYGLFSSAVEAMQNSRRKANRYPIQEPIDLEAALAKRFGVTHEQVMLGCGSIEILKIATDEFTGPSLKPVVAEPTFEAVVAYSPPHRTTPVKVPVTAEFRHDLGRMSAAASEGAGLVFLCNPGNPTGTIADRGEVEQFIRRVPENVVILADEAYAEYVDHPTYESCLRYIHEGRQNVIVSRTFSKIFGMAGMRLGYVIGPKTLVERMRPHRLWNNANQLAIAAATVSIGDEEAILRVRRLNREVRTGVCEQINRMGLAFIPSETNFVTINVGKPSEVVIQQLRDRGILVGRPFASLSHHVRVSLGTAPEMELFFQNFKEVLREKAS